MASCLHMFSQCVKNHQSVMGVWEVYDRIITHDRQAVFVHAQKFSLWKKCLAFSLQL